MVCEFFRLTEARLTHSNIETIYHAAAEAAVRWHKHRAYETYEVSASQGQLQYDCECHATECGIGRLKEKSSNMACATLFSSLQCRLRRQARFWVSTSALSHTQGKLVSSGRLLRSNVDCSNIYTRPCARGVPGCMPMVLRELVDLKLWNVT